MLSRHHLDVVALYFLCLIGFLGYLSFIPLTTIIHAGSPAYEWVLYLILAMLGVGSAGYAALHSRCSRLGMVIGLAVSLPTLLLGLYIGAVFIATPLLVMTGIGCALTLSSFYTLVMLARAWRVQKAWFAGAADRLAAFTILGSAILLALSWHGFGHKQSLVPAPGHMRLSFWGSWNATRLPDEALADLRDTGATMYVFTGEKLSDEDMRDQFRRSMERYAEYDVEVVLASILASHDGFVSTVNYREYLSYTEKLLDLGSRAHLSAIAGVIADAEPPYSIIDPHVQETAQEWIFKENGRYRRWNVAQYRRALDAYMTYIDHFHQRHPSLRIMVSTTELAIFDALDGDADISVAYKFAAYPPQNWDVFNVQVYSSQHAARDAPYFVWQRVKLGQHLLEGSSLSVSVGIVGGGSIQGEAGFQRLVEDIHICRALGVEEVIVFTLGRGLKAFGPEFVTRLAKALDDPALLKIGFSRSSAIAPYIASVWDAVLDLRRARGLIVLGWCMFVTLSYGVSCAKRKRSV